MTHPRIDGQIWVDKNAPNRLKYHIDGQDYTVEVSSNYDYDTTGIAENVPQGTRIASAGTLVKLDESGVIQPASFPMDLENVLGVITNNILVETPGELTSSKKPILTKASISREGYVIVDAEGLESVFYDEDEYALENNIPKHFKKGAPVYWFIGRQTASGYVSPLNSKGKLTFATPVSYMDSTDASYNVGYNNLPIIGNVISWEIEKSKVSKILIHLNFSRFDSSLEWVWPGKHADEKEKIEGYSVNDTKDESKNDFRRLLIKHGLFVADSSIPSPKCFCEILASDEHDSEEYRVEVGVAQKIAESSTTITVSSPKAMYYRISGVVTYAFDRKES